MTPPSRSRHWIDPVPALGASAGDASACVSTHSPRTTGAPPPSVGPSLPVATPLAARTGDADRPRPEPTAKCYSASSTCSASGWGRRLQIRHQAERAQSRSQVDDTESLGGSGAARCLRFGWDDVYGMDRRTRYAASTASCPPIGFSAEPDDAMLLASR